MSGRSPLISIRIVNIDHYVCEPGPLDRKFCPFSAAQLNRVPVIRVFGATPAGQKACLHIHQAYPYFFVPFESTSDDSEEAQRGIYRFGTLLNHALHVSRKDKGRREDQYIAAIVLVKGVPFYGYQVGYETFLKIHLLDPSDKARAIELLQNGVVLNTPFQPYEAHIPYELQFMMDYDLYGMDWLHLRSQDTGASDFVTKFRQPLIWTPRAVRADQPGASPASQEHILYTSDTVPKHFQSGLVGRSSYCELELDTTVMMIANRLDQNERNIHVGLSSEMSFQSSPGSSYQKKLVKSLASIWTDEENRRKSRGIDTPISPITQNEQRVPHVAWSTEAKLRSMMDDLVKHDGKASYEPNTNEFAGVLTAFQAVEALYPKEYFDLAALPTGIQTGEATNLQTSLEQVQCLREGENYDAGQGPATLSSSDHLEPSRFTISDLPARYQAWLETSQADIDHNVIKALVESQSFPDSGAIDDEDLAALAEEVEGDYKLGDSDSDEDAQNIAEWGNDEILASPPSRATARVHIEYENEQGEISPKLEISSIAPVYSRQRKGRNFDIPQNDGGSDEPDLAKGRKIGMEQHQSVKRRKKNIGNGRAVVDLTDLPKGPRVSRARQMPAPIQTSLLRSPVGNIDYFTKFIDGMWSPRAEDQFQYNAFYTDPPQPVSPVQSDENRRKSLVVEEASRLGQSSAYVKQTPKEFVYHPPPPTVLSTGHVTYQKPFFSNPEDVPSRPKIFSGKEFKIVSHTAEHLQPFEPQGGLLFANNDDLWRNFTRIKTWTPALTPPSASEVQEWLNNKTTHRARSRKHSMSQIERPTAENTFDFKYSPTKPKSKVTRTRDDLDILSVEIFVNSRDDLLPDPEHDAVQTVFWSLQTPDDTSRSQDGYLTGIIAVTDFDITKIAIHGLEIDYVEDEESILYQLIEKVRLYDPDILIGFELHNASWGYLIDRAKIYSIDMVDELSRIQGEARAPYQSAWDYRKASIFRVTGRHMANVWRLMRSEVNMTSYTFENVAYHFLHHRMPHFSHRVLTSWYQRGSPALRHRLFRYYLDRVRMNLDILEASEVISRTSESARVFGVDFYSVITRGSQYKVESIMIRIAKPENYMLISPSRKQVAGQRAIECLPLVMEPKSQFYESPLLVLDFQSLYPSIMIAYNYCFSTCLGKVRNPGDPPKLGVTELELPAGLLEQLKDQVNVSPNGVMFVKPSVRKSLLAKMLTDILETRVMVKRSMGDYKSDHGLLRLLNARQGTLKYIANVTYGYTSASFSGRMPAVELADSIVQTGRETLERAIKTINDTAKWEAHVVYGDTDSVFVSLPGRTRDEAFKIGKDIADTITSMNPAPMRLKFEKVYHPCMLIAKKRYVGFKYENSQDKQYVFEAKGIETVRRDGTPATQKIMESCLKILFRSQDMSELKEYLYRQWSKILSNRVPLQDFIIAKEVRLGTYSVQGLPHGAQVAQSRMAYDPRAAPQHGERVPYVVVYRDPNAKLKDRVVRPEALLQDSTLRLDAEYYIRKQIIPPLTRVFNLTGVDIQAWYDEMPRKQKAAALSASHYATHQNRTLSRIDQYYASSHCVVCRTLTHESVCGECRTKPAQTIHTLVCRQRKSQKKLCDTLLICQGCSQLSTVDAAATRDGSTILHGTNYGDIPCDSLDCPVFYERTKAKGDVLATQTYSSLIEQLWPI